MHDLLILLTGLMVILAGWRALARTRDPLSPAVIFAPMLLYMFVYNPWVKLQSGGLRTFFPDLAVLDVVIVAYLLGVTAFCLGLAWKSPSSLAPDRRFDLFAGQLSPSARRSLFRMACLLGVTANAAHLFMIYYSGGWSRIFARAKPTLQSPSGYVAELTTLVFPALLMLALAWQGRRITFPRMLLFVAIAIPQLNMATFFGRRGPMFLIVCTLTACWCIVHSRRPKLRTMVLGSFCLGLMMFLLGGNRSNLFKPWEGEIDFTSVTDRFSAREELSAGDEFIAGCSIIVGTNELGRHYWGGRYFTTFFIRPIPSAIWPSKYHDMGMGWMRDMPGSSGIHDSEWISALGFVPASGNAGGFIPDLFLEFSWGLVVACFLIGRFYNTCWIRWRTRGGFWTLFYFELLILSVYLPTQSVGAWLYRLMLLGLPTWLIWKKIISPSRARGYGGVAAQPAYHRIR
jgi:hypothetical protein